MIRRLADLRAAPARGIRLGLVGAGIQASRTPAMHRAEAATQGLSLTYELIDTDLMDPAPDIAGILDAATRAGFSGLNVTYPFKQAVIPYLDALSPEAERVGAVNTVVLRDGRRVGHNTDCTGFAESLRRGLPDARRDCVLLVGAGGAGGAVAQALIDTGTGRLILADRDPRAAEALAARLRRAGAERVETAGDLVAAAGRADGLVNATPVGMAKLPGMAIPPDAIAPRHWVADIVYFPLRTALLAEAERRGCATLPGSGMAVYQAAAAFALFTGRPADPEGMRRAFEAAAPDAPDGPA